MKDLFKNKKVLLTLVFSLALFFRFYRITQVPLSLNWDETTFAYNAYSILKTGADEYGQKLPLAFKSIGDYKCPLYIYLMVPVIKIFGLNEFSVRFLPSFLGSLTIALLFLIVLELFSDLKLAFWSALILAISPWHLQFTRAGADVAVSSFFLILGIWFFIKAVNSKSKQFLLLTASVTSLALTFYSYYGERFFSPLILLALIFVFQKEIKNKAMLLKFLLIGGLVLLPLIGSLVSSGHQGKILMTTVFGYQPPEEYLNQMREEDKSPLIFYAFHNRLVETGISIISHYLNHFSPSFLLIKGPEDNRQRIEGMGMLYFSDVILLLFGLWALAQNWREKKGWRLILIWLAVAPLPAAITRDLVHARRSFNLVYPLSVILASGLIVLVENLNRFKIKIIKILAVFSLIAFFCWSFGFYWLSYYIFTPLRTSQGSGGWQYGYKQLVEFISPLKSKYNQVVVDTTYQGPYVFFLFYEQYPPEKYQPQAQLVKEEDWSLGEGAGYDQYQFRKIYWPADRGLSRTLFAGPPEKIPQKDLDPKQANLLKVIYFPDGTEAFYVVETK